MLALTSTAVTGKLDAQSNVFWFWTFDTVTVRVLSE